MKKKTVFLIAILTSFLLSNVVTLPVMIVKGLFHDAAGSFTMLNYIRWELFVFVTFMLFNCLFMSHKFAAGRGQELLFVVAAILLIAELFCYLLFTLIECKFDFKIVDWYGSLDKVMTSWKYYLMLVGVFALLLILYALFVNRNFLQIFSRTGFNVSGKLKQVNDSNLENSRWMTDAEKKKIFKVYDYAELVAVDKDGIPVLANLDSKGKRMEVAFNSPCHAIVIG